MCRIPSAANQARVSIRLETWRAIAPTATSNTAAGEISRSRIRGYRIEPGEIESALEKHEAVKDAVVLAREDAPGLTQLVAYIVPRDGVEVSIGELRGFLKQHVPDYMLPALFVFLQKLPLNANGKIDRQALPKPDRSRADVIEELAGPRTPTEEALASIWSTILKLDRIGIHEDFFELGGHSLLATQVTSRISDVFQIEVPLRRLFELPTLAELSAAVDELVRTGTEKKPRILSGTRFSERHGACGSTPGNT